MKEYWIIHPEVQTLLIYTLRKAKYEPSKLFTLGDVVSSEGIQGFHMDLDTLFRGLD